jgi:tetratricopeptide (TPR) repeat protein
MDCKKKTYNKYWRELILLFSVAVLLYLQSISFGLIKFDDDTIIERNETFLSSPSNLPKVFLTDAFLDGRSQFYRPLQSLSYMVDIAVAGNNINCFLHLTNVLLFAIITCLLFLLQIRLNVSRGTAFTFTMLYGIHPLFISNVAWIPARGDLLLTLFLLVSFLALINFLESRKIISLSVHLAAFLITLFCKETAAVVPVLFIFFYLIYQPVTRYKRKDLFIVLFYIFSGLVWLWIRSKAIIADETQLEHMGLINLTAIFIQNIRVIPESISSFFIPLNIGFIPSFSIFKLISGIIILGLLGVVLFRKRKKNFLLLVFWLCWFLLLLLPTMLYKHERIDYLPHRFLLPLIGIVMVIVLSFSDELEKLLNYRWIIILLFLVFFSLSFLKTRSYSNPLSFYNSVIVQNPTSCFAYNNRGYLFFKQRSYDKAIADYSQALTLNNRYAQAFYNRGYAFFNKGAYRKAIDDYSKAIDLAPDYADSYNNRAVAFVNLEMYDEAIADFTEVIKIEPRNAMAYCNRGKVYYYKGLPEDAFHDFKVAAQLGSVEAKEKLKTLALHGN